MEQGLKAQFPLCVLSDSADFIYVIDLKFLLSRMHPDFVVFGYEGGWGGIRQLFLLRSLMLSDKTKLQ